MHLKLILAAIVVVIALGVSISTISNEKVIQKEEIKDFSYFPMPTLPSAKVLDSTVSIQSMQNSIYATKLINDYDLISVKQDPFYDEVTLFYATPKIQQTIDNDDSIQNLVKKGVIVFDYERIDNLEARTSNDKSIFMTKNSNPVYIDSGLNGEYLVVSYPDDNLRLSVYGNDSIDLRELIKSLDL